MISRRHVALAIIFVTFAVLAAVAKFGPDSASWISIGILSALGLSFLGSVTTHGITRSRDLRSPIKIHHAARASFRIRNIVQALYAHAKIEVWQLLIGLLGLALLILAISLEHPFFSSGESGSFIFNKHSLVLLFTELAFALFIALAISLTIERRAKEHDNKERDKMRRMIADDVFRGVFAEGLPRDYIDAVVARCLKVQIIRPWVRTIDNISQIDDELSKKIGPMAGDLLKSDRIIEFSLKNVSGRDVVETLRGFGPVKHKKLSGICGITRLVVDGVEYSTEEISELTNMSADGWEWHYEIPLTMSDGAQIMVTIETTHFKLRKDNEVWSTFFPTMKFEMIFRSSEKLRSLGFANRSGANLSHAYSDAEKGIGSWTIEGPMLPSDSVTYWWNAD